MELTTEIQDFTLAFLEEHPGSTAIQLAKALNSSFPNLPAVRKTGNQILYKMEKASLVRSDKSAGKPTWFVL